MQLKCNCIDGRIMNVLLQPALFSFALDKPPGQKLYEHRIKPFFQKK